MSKPAARKHRAQTASAPGRTVYEWGWIYFAAQLNDDRTTAAVKIGFSRDPFRRVKALNTASPHEIVLKVVVPGTRADEYAFHEYFAAERISGEWFDPSDEMRRIVESLYQLVTILPTWDECIPFAGEAQLKADTSALTDRLGPVNSSLARSLHEHAGTGRIDSMFMALAHNNRGIDPAGPVMEYGLRAAIAYGVAKPSYILACCERGVEEGSVA